MLQVGNPTTKSVPVNVLIKVIKKAEVRRQGKPSEARREIERAECLQTLQILNDNPESHNCTKRRFMMTAASKFQFSMVAGVDNVCHFEEQDLKPNPDYPASLKTRMGLLTRLKNGEETSTSIIEGRLYGRLSIALYVVDARPKQRLT